ncbi:MAG: hypothetical protein HYU60_06145 [Magnetospirillum sp.]|nr:hypothetical protein [Magnetospirillum sp.]
MTQEPTEPTATSVPAPDLPPPEVAPAAQAPETAPKRASWGGLIAVVVLALLAAAATVTYPRWSAQFDFATTMAPPPKPPVVQPANEVAALQSELLQTRERLRQLEARLSQPVAAPAHDESRVAALEAALVAIQARPQVPARLVDEVEGLSRQVVELRKTAADAAAVLRLADRIEQTEASVRELSQRRASAVAMLLAVGQLRETVNMGYPFDAELRALKAIAHPDEAVQKAVDALAERAAAGIPTRMVLAERFWPLAPRVVRAEALPQGDTWWRATLNRLLSLVTIRREDGAAAGETAAAVAARAEARLSEGDLAAAAAELSGLSGGPAEVAGHWLADARARVAAERALADLTAHTIALTGAGR